LQLCCNQLRTLPAEIGHLTSLRTLDLSGNQLRRLPETIGHLERLTVLRVSRNRLQELPRSIGQLQRLERLAVDRNRLEELPSEIGRLKRLTWMDVRWNTELAALPAEIARLAFLRRLRTTGCPLQRRRISHRDHDPVGPPSLRELAARTIIRHQLSIPVDTPAPVKRYLASAGQCSECNGPFFEHVHWRRRLFSKQHRELWLEHRLCTCHWSDERGRIASLFGELP
ncbi:hypothetical protein THASP1DRAFT_10551, partial [Thamnocephalis sphaerospora]